MRAGFGYPPAVPLPHRLTHSLRAVALLLAALGLADTAAADAIMPPPDDCPRGEKGVSSHAGPRCVKEAPTDCPPGWRGALGGDCMLRPCTGDEQCDASEACVEHSVCLQHSEDGFYDYGETPEPGDTEESGALPKNYAPDLLGGPPMPKIKRKKPIIRYEAVNLCAPSVACAAPHTCQTEKLCAPKGKRAVAYLGTNISPIRVARKTETPLVQSEAAPTETASPATPQPGTAHGGCAACAVGSGRWGGGGDLGWLAGAVVGLAIGRRATRRGQLPGTERKGARP